MVILQLLFMSLFYFHGLVDSSTTLLLPPLAWQNSLFAYFNSSILYSIRLFCNRCFFAIKLFPNAFENSYLQSCWFHCFNKFYIKFRVRETFMVVNSVTWSLLTETLYTFRTIEYWNTLLQQKISEICTLFQPVKLQIFCILMIDRDIAWFYGKFQCKTKRGISQFLYYAISQRSIW